MWVTLQNRKVELARQQLLIGEDLLTQVGLFAAAFDNTVIRACVCC